jgi:DNA repair protein RadD
MKLRAYQKAAINSIFTYFRFGNRGHPLIVAPTGSGKSHIIAGFCAEVYEKYPAQNILVITHTKEIIRQDVAKLKHYVPPNLVGIYSRGLGRSDIRQFTVAGIQTIYKRADLFAHFNFIIVDEAHLIPPDGEGRYRTFFAKIPKGVPILGVTATPFRRASGMLTEGHLFDKIIYEIELQTLIDQDYLVPLRAKKQGYTFNTKGITVTGGDFNKAQLSSRFDQTHVTDQIIPQLLQFRNSHKHWLIFAIDIDHCEHIADQLNKAGIIAAAVHSKLDIDRRHLLDLFLGGRIQALIAVETLTTGFDAPDVDLIGMLRPTASPVLHVQMLGRGMRPADGKKECLVLDFAGNVQRLGPVDAVQVRSKKEKGKGKGTGFTRICPDCSEIVHISKQLCPACGYAFPPPKTKLNTTAGTNALLKGDYKPQTVQVNNVTYSKHKKPGKPPSLKVTYSCGLLFYNEWIAFEHEGYPKKRAAAWWHKWGGHAPVPATVDEALNRIYELQAPTAIKLELIGQWPSVIGHMWNEPTQVSR